MPDEIVDLLDRADHQGTQPLSTISDAGDAAGKNTGTTAGTVAAGDDPRFPTSDEKDALTNAPTSPNTGNPFVTLADVGALGGGTVTSVSVSGSDGLEVDSGSPVTTAGTIALGVDAAALRTHINVADGATDDTAAAAAQATADAAAVTLEDAVNTASPDNDVVVPAGDPVAFRDGAVEALTPVTIAKTSTGTDPALKVEHGTNTRGIDVEGTLGRTTRIAGAGVIFDGESTAIGGYNIFATPAAASDDGKSVAVTAGDATGPGDHDGGSLVLSAGQEANGGTPGQVIIGGIQTSSVEVGAANVPTNILQDLTVTGTTTLTAKLGVDQLEAGTNGYVLETVAGVPTWQPNAGGGGDVTAAANIAADSIVVGDDGAKGIKDSGTSVSDLLPKSGGVMSGPITTDSTIDGRDVNADGTNLDAHLALTAEHIDWSVTGAEQVHADRYVSGGGGGTVDSVVGNLGISVDATDPANPELALEAIVHSDLETLVPDAGAILASLQNGQIAALTDIPSPAGTETVLVEEAGVKKRVSISNFPTGGGGEVNSGANVGSGADVFSAKNGLNLEMRGINAASAKVTAVVNGDNVDIDLGAVALADLSDGAAQQAAISANTAKVTYDDAATVSANTAAAAAAAAAIAAHALLDENPHSTELADLLPGVHSDLENAAPDAGAIFASLQDGQIAALTDIPSPAGTETILVEEAGVKKRISVSALPGGVGSLMATQNLADLDDAATARTNLGVDQAGLANLTAGTHSDLETAAPDAGAIFASLQQGQVAALPSVAAASGQFVPIELATGEWRNVDMDDLLGGGAGTVDTSGTPEALDFARFTDADTIEGRSPAETLADIGADAAGTARPPTAHTLDSHTGVLALNKLATGADDLVLKMVGGVPTWTTEAGGAVINVSTLEANRESEYPAASHDGEFHFSEDSRAYAYSLSSAWEDVGVLADDASIEIDATNGLQLKGFDAANEGDVPSKVSGALSWGAPTGGSGGPDPVRAATVIAGSLGSNYENGDTIDGVVLATDDRLLIKDGVTVGLGTYTYDNAAGIPDGIGEAQPVPDTTDSEATTSINFFDSNSVSVDNSAAFANLRIGDQIKLDTLTYIVDGTPTDNTTYWTVPVAFHPSTSETFPVTQGTIATQGLFNGIYTVNASGAPTRATDFAAASSQAAASVIVQEGNENNDKLFLCTNDAGSDVVDTDRLVFSSNVQPVYANGFGGFKAGGEDPATNADNGYFNAGTALAVAAPDTSGIGIRFAGKPFERGWGFASGAPLHVQSIMANSGGPGSHIILRQRDDPTKVCIYRNESPPTLTTGANDDTFYPDVTFLGATFDHFEGEKIYETTVIPQSPIVSYSGSGVLTLSGSTFGKRYGTPLTSPYDWNWQQAFAGATDAPTTALYDHTGILMPSNGVVMSVRTQFYLQDGTSWLGKPELTRLRPETGTSNTTNTAMTNTSITGSANCTVGEMEEFEQTPAGLAAKNLAETTFEAGDKLLLTLQEISNTGGVNLRFDWTIKMVFVDPVPVGEAPGD